MISARKRPPDRAAALAGGRRRKAFGAGTSALLAIFVWAGAAWADEPTHGFAALSMAPDGRHVASLESRSAPGGGVAPSRLVIRDVTTGAAISAPAPCGSEPACSADAMQYGAPAWSPDGRSLAYTVRAPGGHARSIYRVNANGTGLARLASFDGTLITLRYSRNGRLAGLGIAMADKEVGATAAAGPSKAATRQIQRIMLIENGAAVPASPPGLFVYEYDWRPDGAGFAATGAELKAGNADGDNAWWGARLYAVDAASAAARLIYAPPDDTWQIAFPRVSPDGRDVGFISGLMSDFGSVGGEVFLAPFGSGAPSPGGNVAARNLTPRLAGTVISIGWDCRGESLLAGMASGVGMAIGEVRRRGGGFAKLWAGDEQLAASDGMLARSCANGSTATVRQDFARAPEIAVGAIGKWLPITHENAGATAPLSARKLRWSNEGMRLSGWLLRPASADPAARLPLIVVVHGGPGWADIPAFEAPGLLRALLDKGYALLLPNPRGGFGEGEVFVRANRRDFGGGDFRDIMAGVDAAGAAAPLDLNRLGITGVSYGGYMSMWAPTQTRRFRAAVARAGISDWSAYARQTGIPGWLQPYFGATAGQDPAAYARPSPLRLIDRTRTPTLLAVGAGDIECPPPQSEAFFRALKAHGVATDMVVYPGEGHEISDPAHAADLTARTTAWFDRYLR